MFISRANPTPSDSLRLLGALAAWPGRLSMPRGCLANSAEEHAGFGLARLARPLRLAFRGARKEVAYERTENGGIVCDVGARRRDGLCHPHGGRCEAAQR